MSEKPKKQLGEKVSLGYAWYALGVLFFINLINYVDRLSIGPAMEHIKRDFNVTDAKMGMIAGAFMLTYAILSLPMGYVSDKGRRTGIVALGAALWSIATTLSGFCKGFWLFFVARGAVGVGEGTYAPSGTALVADYFPKRLRNTSIAIFMSAMIVGGAIAYIVSGIILNKTERMNVPLVTQMLVDEEQQDVAGWKYLGVEETKNREVRFTFEGPGGLQVFADFRRLKDKSDEFSFQSKLFSVNYLLDGDRKVDEAGAEVSGVVTPLVEVLNARILEREGKGLEKLTALLKEKPHNFKVPDEYADRLEYDEENQQLVFKGIMTKHDKDVIGKISDNEHYIKAVGVIHSRSAYNYVRSDNWRWIFWILGPPGLIFALLAFFLKEPLKGGSEDFLSEEEARKVEESGKTDYSILYKTPSIVFMIFSNILATFCVGGLNTWLFPFVERYKGIESADAAIKFGPIVVGFAVLGVIISGVLADKLQKVTPRGNNYIIVAGILLGIPPMYLFLYTESYFLMIAGISLCIFFLTWINGPMNALLMSLVEPRLRAMLNGVHILLIHLLGDAISPFIIGYQSDLHNLRYALAMLPIYLAVGAIGFMVAGIFVPKDLKSVEERMKGIAGGGDSGPVIAH